MTTREVAARFHEAVATAAGQLRVITEETASQPSCPGGWLKKQELGHLLDSAQNNHQRIAIAALEGRYEGPTYAQNAWVDLHGYAEMPWSHLLRHWEERNWMLGRLIARIPEERLSAQVILGGGAPMRLEAWIDDYIQHLQHHVETITTER
ncbi:DinB family protein [Paludibaculum fermentans]|uniref:DinB family protein n=1 Tax=Paludibaculum fermentans TaxID=1473598 RepID=A0A7S7NM76_PALFE|nr:DinB family protein [Paludibaculum fermentans]QOY86217.1 DinB family protein [Paludibaculum fermentans]